MRIWKRLLPAILCTLALGWMLPGCSSGEPAPIEYVIGISQANMREPWRLVMAREIEEEAAKHPGIRLVFTDATQDSEKQVSDIRHLLEYGIDLLIVSPLDVKKLTPVVSEVYQSIPVIVLDRVVEGFDYSLFIGPDNEIIGRQAGEAVADLAPPDCRVLEIQGNPKSQASADRSKGFRLALSEIPGFSVDSLTVESESRDSAEDLILSIGREVGKYDILFAHNDYMALGARRALERLGLEIPIVGIDGFTGKDGGLDLIRQGAIARTITCPTGGREAIQYSLDILKRVSGVPKQVILRSHCITQENVDGYEAGLDPVLKKPDRTVRVGYAQVGTESAWRLANTKSIKEAAREFGVDLLYADADQHQERQIAAMRDFIRQGVDVIVLSPVVDNGWDQVLWEAKEAGIPVLLSDRRIKVEDDSLYMTYFGVDAVEEGRRAMRWLLANSEDIRRPVRILELQGTIGASPTNDRHAGFEEILRENPDYRIVYAESGDYTIEGGEDVVEHYLAGHDWDIDVIFAHNDDMAIGTIQALERNGIRPGQDVRIISVDGTKIAFQAMVDKKLNCAVECSPLLGPQLMKAITELMSGKELPLRIITEEKVYTQENAAEFIDEREY